MASKRFVVGAVELWVGVVLLLLIAGAALGQPVLLGYVETGSMAPTMEPGDGFVAVPSALTDEPEVGDVVVFRAEEIQGGGLTTHRIVGETEQGYVTRGDANPFTDQDGDEPPVKEAQIVAEAWQVGGSVVVIPQLGTAVTGIRGTVEAVQRTVSSLLGTRALLGPQGLADLFFGATALYYLVGELRGDGRERRLRETDRDEGIDPRLFALGFTLLLVGGATAAMVGPAGTQQYGVVSAEFDSERPTVIPAGTSANVTYAVGNGGFVPVHVFLEPASEGVAVHPEELTVDGRRVANATVTLSAPPQTGYYRRFVAEHRYLAVLPHSVTESLYRVHPWAPIVAVDALLGVPFYLLAVALVGSGRVRNRSRNRAVPMRRRIRRAVRGLYARE
ncbi:signal peptidase I [Halogeometricum sp. CBA1124]|uniref:signal peptidase I n=1 Tax=Halogeometricum sp. CBA1124 TaxID=2668071 RepID=UPI00142C83DE|nr:signal peptidase I [Halogeometricum sp. CBA1124]MUV58422.1 signal peptidase I [Halogeometricum sp. CBA1124]